MNGDIGVVPDSGLKTGPQVPKCMLIEVLGRYSWLNPRIMKILRARYGTRFILLVGNHTVKTACQDWCAEGDKIIVYDEIEAAAARAGGDPVAASAEARQNESEYGIVYLQDIIQQDRTIYGTYMAYAASSWAKRSIPTLDQLTARINFYFDWARRLLGDEGVDLVDVRPGGLMSTTLVHVAMRKEIPVTMSRPARYGSYVTWTYGPYSAGDVFEDAYHRQEGQGELPQEVIRPPEGSRQVFEQFRRQSSLKSLIRSLLLATYNHVVHSYEAFRVGVLDQMPSYRTIIQDILYSWWSLHKLEKMSERSIEKIAQTPFLLFLLPKEPEYTVQSLAREFSNVQGIVQQMALAMPAGYKLLVKEHSRVGYRRLDFYRDLLKLPNVVLVSATIPGLELIEMASAVSTVAGTAALEAALLGKPSIIFTPRVEYSFLPSVRIIRSFHELAGAVRDALQSRSTTETEAIRRAGARYRMAVKTMSFDAAGTKVFEGNAPLSEDQAERAVNILLHVFNLQCSRSIRSRYGTSG